MEQFKFRKNSNLWFRQFKKKRMLFFLSMKNQDKSLYSKYKLYQVITPEIKRHMKKNQEKLSEEG